MFFQSNLRTIDPINISVSRKTDNSYAFSLIVQLNLGETVTFYANWIAEGQITGNYSINVSAVSNDPNIDTSFRSCEDDEEVQIVEDVPVIYEPVMSPAYNPPGLDPEQMYIYPGEDVTTECNITCPIGVKNVTLYYSVALGGIWNQIGMNGDSGNEWTAVVPAQPEGTSVVIYIEAFGPTEKSSRTREYKFIVSDLQALETRTKAITVATAATILVGCITIFTWKRRRTRELL